MLIHKLSNRLLPPQGRFTNNLQNSIYWWAEPNRNQNRNPKRRGHIVFGRDRHYLSRAGIECIDRAYRYCETLQGHRNVKNQRLRASQAMALNSAAGNGKATNRNRRRYFEIARASAGLRCDSEPAARVPGVVRRRQ
ncbi:four helix bundle protein [Thiohalocapsa halophila]|uniref:four helix bundle protein n=1 Tax=Thiohalocapsa halophila TaxID=69359 RepID=UPI001902D886